MTGDGSPALRIARWAGVISAITAAALLTVVCVYIAYVYALWTHAMKAEGTPGVPPP